MQHLDYATANAYSKTVLLIGSHAGRALVESVVREKDQRRAPGSSKIRSRAALSRSFGVVVVQQFSYFYANTAGHNAQTNRPKRMKKTRKKGAGSSSPLQHTVYRDVVR